MHTWAAEVWGNGQGPGHHLLKVLPLWPPPSVPFSPQRNVGNESQALLTLQG